MLKDLGPLVLEEAPLESLVRQRHVADARLSGGFYVAGLLAGELK